MPRLSARSRSESRISVLAALLLLGACAHRAPPAERLYVSDERGDAIAVIDPTTGTVVDHISAGRRPRGLALSPDGATLYVAISGSPIGGPEADEGDLPPSDHKADGVAVVDLASAKVLRVLNVGRDPETFALSRDGRLLFVSNEDAGTISEVAVDGSRTPGSAKVGEEPEGVAISGDGTHVFVACEGSDHVAMLDARTLGLIRTISIKGRPRGLLASRDGAHVFATAETAGKLAILSAETGKIEKMLDLARGDPAVRPMGMTETPDGHLFVTTGRYGALLEVDPMAGTILRRIENVGERPWGIGATSDGSILVTANGPSGDVSLINRMSGKIVRKLNVGKAPWGVAALPASGRR